MSTTSSEQQYRADILNHYEVRTQQNKDHGQRLLNQPIRKWLTLTELKNQAQLASSKANGPH